jgi:ATP-dependent DNA helicase RecG
MLTLATKLSELGWIRSISKELYKKLDITTVFDLLSHVPTRYLDFTIGTKIEKIQEGETMSFVAKIESFRNVFTKYGKNIQEAVVSDESGQLDVIWFNQKFLSRVMIPGQTMAFSGKVGIWKKRLALIVPQYEVIPSYTDNDYEQIHTGRLVPVYSETKGLTSKAIRTHIHKLLNNPTFFVSEFLPEYFLNHYHLISESQAYKEVHFPTSIETATKARYRLSFDELFLVQLSSELVRRKRQEKQKRKAFQVEKYKTEIDNFILSLPFTLTAGQLQTISEIKKDFRQPFPMNRILVGDVGSGKTIVSAIAAYITHLNGLKRIMR